MCKPLKDNISALLKRFKESADPALNLEVLCTWENVLSCLGSARDERDNRERGILNFPRRVITTAGDHADVFEPWFKMIPDDLRILYGGLSVIFRVRSSRPSDIKRHP